MAVTKAMTLAQMRTFVRSALDTDSTDVPDDLLDRWLIEGSDRIESFSDTWTFREVDEDFSVVAGTQSYKIRNPSRNAGISADIHRIEDLWGPFGALEPRNHQRIRAQYLSTTTATSTPRWYSIWADSLYLWPKPSANGTYYLSGYREPTDWVGSAAAPDFPDEFHELVAWWALSLGHAREGDPGMAAYYSDLFQSTLGSRAASYVTRGVEQPLILNAEAVDLATALPFGRMRYDWE